MQKMRIYNEMPQAYVHMCRWPIKMARVNLHHLSCLLCRSSPSKPNLRSQEALESEHWHMLPMINRALSPCLLAKVRAKACDQDTEGTNLKNATPWTPPRTPQPRDQEPPLRNGGRHH